MGNLLRQSGTEPLLRVLGKGSSKVAVGEIMYTGVDLKTRPET